MRVAVIENIRTKVEVRHRVVSTSPCVTEDAGGRQARWTSAGVTSVSAWLRLVRVEEVPDEAADLGALEQEPRQEALW